MDLLLIQYLREKKGTGIKEFMRSAPQRCPFHPLLVLWSIISVIWAIGASWHCNTILGTDFLMKIINAFVASMFSNIYLVLRYFDVIDCAPATMF